MSLKAAVSLALSRDRGRDTTRDSQRSQDENAVSVSLLGEPSPETPRATSTIAVIQAAPEQAADEAADRAAIAADTWPGPRPDRPGEPPADLVGRLAAALAVERSCQRMTDRDRALRYFRSEALRRLMRLDPLAPGLLVGEAERHAGAPGSSPHGG